MNKNLQKKRSFLYKMHPAFESNSGCLKAAAVRIR